MQKHAIALGYFFLAILCIYVSQHGSSVFYSILVAAGATAFFVGFAFFVAATVDHNHLKAVKGLLANLIQQAQQPPNRESAPAGNPDTFPHSK